MYKIDICRYCKSIIKKCGKLLDDVLKGLRSDGNISSGLTNFIEQWKVEA